MVEYLVTEVPSEHLTTLAEAEQMADELKEITGTKHGVYVLLSTYYPTRKETK